MDGIPTMGHVHPRTNTHVVRSAASDYGSNGSNYVPSADQYPRRGAGRKGAYRRRMRWRQRHPCPRHHDERSGQDQGNGGGQGSDRVLHVPYRADTHGLSRLTTVN